MVSIRTWAVRNMAYQKFAPFLTNNGIFWFTTHTLHKRIVVYESFRVTVYITLVLWYLYVQITLLHNTSSLHSPGDNWCNVKMGCCFDGSVYYKC